MSRGDLQEMEASTKQSKTAVNANAKPADPMPTMADPGTQLGSVEDLEDQHLITTNLMMTLQGFKEFQFLPLSRM